MPGQTNTLRRIRNGERWTHLLCLDCGNHLPRSRATTPIEGATGPLQLHHVICCGDENCRGYGSELMRAVQDPFASDYLATRPLPDTQP